MITIVHIIRRISGNNKPISRDVKELSGPGIGCLAAFHKGHIIIKRWNHEM
jgi:hypothetical protein